MFDNLFEARKRLYPQKIKGRFRRLKWILNSLFISIYLFFPFIRFDRPNTAPDQAILVDFPGGKAYFFFIEIWPQEAYYLAGILIIAAIILFFITSLFGRIWCGYACFQTVWTDIFIALEHLFQGDRNERIILDRKNSFKKIWRKSMTHLSWIVVSLITGYGFVCYFTDAFLLTQNLLQGQVSLTILGWISGIAAMTYIMAGFAREHVCTYMCPYSRFQSAMFDKNTLIITYDKKRGEDRGKWRKNEPFENRGHCIDCKQCVVVCPTGIDIRDGLQMECIACGLCIDACDDMMHKVGLPKGLIRYDTMDHLADPTPKKKFRILRTRTILYSFIIITVSTLMLRSLIFKTTLETSITPDRNPLFVKMSDGAIRNGYTIKILNKTHEKKTFSLVVSTPKQALLRLQNGDLDQLRIEPNQHNAFKVYVTLPADLNGGEGRRIVNFDLLDEEKNVIKKLSGVFIFE